MLHLHDTPHGEVWVYRRQPQCPGVREDGGLFETIGIRNPSLAQLVRSVFASPAVQPPPPDTPPVREVFDERRFRSQWSAMNYTGPWSGLCDYLCTLANTGKVKDLSITSDWKNRGVIHARRADGTVGPVLHFWSGKVWLYVRNPGASVGSRGHEIEWFRESSVDFKRLELTLDLRS